MSQRNTTKDEKRKNATIKTHLYIYFWGETSSTPNFRAAGGPRMPQNPGAPEPQKTPKL